MKQKINYILMILAVGVWESLDGQTVDHSVWVQYSIFMIAFTVANYDFYGRKLTARNIFICVYAIYYSVGILFLPWYVPYTITISIYKYIIYGYAFSLTGYGLVIQAGEMYKPTIKTASNLFKPKKLKLLLSISLVMSGVALLFWFHQIGRIPIFSENIQSSRVGLAGAYYARQLSTVALPFFWFYLVSFRQLKMGKSLLFVSFFLCSAMLVTQGYRTFLLAYWVISILIYEKVNTKSVSYLKLLTYALIILVVIAGYGLMRYWSSDDGLTSKKSSYELLLQITMVRVMTLQNIIDIFPSAIDYQWGAGYFRAFGFLFPGSQMSQSTWLKLDVLHTDFQGGGHNPGMLGELYLNFGGIGIVLGMFIYGVVLAFADNQGKKDDYLHKVLSSICVTYLIVAMSPGITNELFSIIWFTVLSLMSYFLLIWNKR